MTATTTKPNTPYLKTAEQMARICGIGEATLRHLMDANELEYLQIGNRRLIADTAIWNYYERCKVPATVLTVESIPQKPNKIVITRRAS